MFYIIYDYEIPLLLNYPFFVDLRVLFERAVSQIPKEKSREIWNLFVQFEYDYGDLEAMLKVEKRKSSLYPEELGNYPSFVITSFSLPFDDYSPSSFIDFLCCCSLYSILYLCYIRYSPHISSGKSLPLSRSVARYAA